ESCATGAVFPAQLVAVLHRLLLALAPLQVTSAADTASGAPSTAAHAAMRIFRDVFFPPTAFIAPPIQSLYEMCPSVQCFIASRSFVSVAASIQPLRSPAGLAKPAPARPIRRSSDRRQCWRRSWRRFAY